MKNEKLEALRVEFQRQLDGWLNDQFVNSDLEDEQGKILVLKELVKRADHRLIYKIIKEVLNERP